MTDINMIGPPAPLGLELIGPPAPLNPQTAVEEQKKRGVWQNLLNNFNDPNFRQAFFMTGAQLMRSPGFGQSFGDVASNALTTGMGTLQQLRAQDEARRQQQQENARKDAEAQRAKATSDAYVAATGEQTAASKEKRAREAEEAAYGIKMRPTLEKRAQTAAEVDADLKRSQAARNRAEASYTRSGRTGGAARTTQELQKIEMLSRKYQAEGLDKVQADAKAVELLDLQKAAKTPGELAQGFYVEKLKAWQNNIDNLGKQLDKETAKGLLDEAIAEATELTRLDVNSREAVPGANDIQAPGGMRIADPKITALIEAAKKTSTPEEIRSALIQKGVDPKLYGY